MADAGTTAKAGQVTVVPCRTRGAWETSQPAAAASLSGCRGDTARMGRIWRGHADTAVSCPRHTRMASCSHGADMAGTRGRLLDRLELMTYSKAHQRPPKATRCVLKCGGPLDRVQLTVCLHRPGEPYMALGGTCL